MADAKDDNHACSRCSAGVNEPYDALDDASHVWIFQLEFSQRIGVVLGGVEYYWCSDTRICNRLGASWNFCLVFAGRTGTNNGSSVSNSSGGECTRCSRK